ncbi:MAG: hypothetical protein BWY71_02054 [Planctomycetes bacterium ADurb.Bin412]|nr:MAG: hypothetical protein BWY71_02054 [Planctomycetes bacterium ADurb.Bin412]
MANRSAGPVPLGVVFALVSSLAAIIGASVKEMKKDTTEEIVAVRPRSLKNCPMIPPIKAMGTNTTTLASVVEATARAISVLPFSAASSGE